MPRVLYHLSHPIQYQSPLLRHLTTQGTLDVHTLYGRSAATEGYFDSGFGTQVTWDIPLLEGHSHEVLRASHLPRLGSRATPWHHAVGEAFNRFRPDVLWLHGYDHVTSLRLLTLARRRGVPVVVRAEVESSDAHGGPLTRQAKDQALRQLYRRFDAFLAIGDRNRAFYLARGVPQSKIFAAPYAVDNARFGLAREDGADARLRDQFELPPDGPIYVYSGKFLARKRPQDAIHALYRLRTAHGVEGSLVMVGSGPLLQRCVELAAELGLTDRVRFPGFVNQSALPGVYAGSTALLLVSERERWGLVANEAMASGCPVIAYRSVGCADDLVVDGRTGLVVPTGDLAALAASMAHLAEPAAHREIARRAVDHVSGYSFRTIETGLLAAVAHVRAAR